MLNCIAVGIGGFVGSVLRYLIGLIPVSNQSGFPYKTLIINILGSLLIGVITALAAKNMSINPRLVLFLKVGICGGFTTFSTFSLETMTLLQSGRLMTALIYVLLSVCLSLTAVFLAGKLAV